MKPERLDALRARMEETGTDLVALGPGPHMDWLAGFHPHPDERPCFLMVSQSAAGFLMPALNAEEARKSTDLPFWTWADADGPARALADALAALGNRAQRIGLDETMRTDFALMLIEALPDADRRLATETIGRLRLRKDADEIAALKAEALIADGAQQALRAAIRPGATERELAEIAKAHFAAHGAQVEFGIVGTGDNGAFPHHHTSGAKVRPGDAIVVDIGGRSGLYPSDITRMAACGQPPEGYAEAHEIVEAAVQAALAAVKPGALARAVDAAARNVIADAGYGEHFVHRTGHGLGIEIHEPPYITGTSETVLEEGMVFSIEPGIYLQGRFGLRLEDIVVVRADGAEILSELPRDLYVAG